jgi:cytochrome b involved in lipid metabolism
MTSSPNKETFKFIYKNTEYDCTEYSKKHPGGLEFFQKMKEEKQDITEYFRSLHSK